MMSLAQTKQTEIDVKRKFLDSEEEGNIFEIFRFLFSCDHVDFTDKDNVMAVMRKYVEENHADHSI